MIGRGFVYESIGNNQQQLTGIGADPVLRLRRNLN
jgi:hypothetical protein